MKITKELCKNVLSILNAEATKRPDKNWLGALFEYTEEAPYQEAVAELLYSVWCNSPTFTATANKRMSAYLEKHPELTREQAQILLYLEQVIRLIVYTYKHAEEVQELSETMDLD